MKIFVIDWNGSNTSTLVDICISKGHQVEQEYVDGGLAYKNVAAQNPDLILINMDVKPSHGKQTAESIKQRKSTSHIPIYFVCKENKDEKQYALGKYISLENLSDIL